MICLFDKIALILITKLKVSKETNLVCMAAMILFAMYTDKNIVILFKDTQQTFQ